MFFMRRGIAVGYCNVMRTEVPLYVRRVGLGNMRTEVPLLRLDGWVLGNMRTPVPLLHKEW